MKLPIIFLLAISIVPFAIHSAHGSTASPGFAVTSYATGFTSNGVCAFSCGGPIGLAFDASGNGYIGDFVSRNIYKFGPTGGGASPGTELASANSLSGHTPAGMAFGKDGNLYVNLLDVGEIVQLDTNTGAIIRTVTSSVPGACGLATDPLSGDLFVSQACGFAGVGAFRVSNIEGSATVSVYTSGICLDGLAFGADGTLFGAHCGVGIVRIDGTNSAIPGAFTSIASLPFSDGMAVSSNPSTPFLFGNRNDGIITKVDLSTNPPTLTDIVTGGTRGDFATVGSDGCLYASQSDSIVKVTNADGTCIPPPLGPLTLPPNVGQMHVSKFFTDSSLNPLPLDSHGNPMVNVVLARGVVESTNPGEVLAWVNVNNTGSSLQSLALNETLPADWTINPAWLPGKGAIHVYFANSTSLATNPEITQPKTITVVGSNPQTVVLSIKNFNATSIGHPLMPGQSILLSVKLSYGLKTTSQSFASYPRNYTDTATAVAWTQASFKGIATTGTISAFFTAYAKVDGDPGGDNPIVLVSKYAIT